MEKLGKQPANRSTNPLKHGFQSMDLLQSSDSQNCMIVSLNCPSPLNIRHFFFNQGNKKGTHSLASISASKQFRLYSALHRTPASLFTETLPLKKWCLFTLCVRVFSLHICLCSTCMPGIRRGQKRTWDLQMAVNCHVDTRNWTQHLWKCKCS